MSREKWEYVNLNTVYTFYILINSRGKGFSRQQDSRECYRRILYCKHPTFIQSKIKETIATLMIFNLGTVACLCTYMRDQLSSTCNFIMLKCNLLCQHGYISFSTPEFHIMGSRCTIFLSSYKTNMWTCKVIMLTSDVGEYAGNQFCCVVYVIMKKSHVGIQLLHLS